MKKISIITLILAAMFSFSSCIKEVFPEDGTVTWDQILDTPVETRIMGLHSWMNKMDVLGYGDELYHFDFGYPALIIQREMMGQDVLHDYPMYGWWDDWRQIHYLTYEYANASMPWRWYYRMIEMANSIISTTDSYETVAEHEQIPLGITYAYRAFAYFDLARLYIKGRYIGNEDGATVPIVTEKTTPKEAANNPRAEAYVLYELILEDLRIAELLLDGYYGYDRILPDISVVEGMLARVHLEMGNWALAEQYAASAQAGYTPVTESEWSDREKGFNSPNNAWIWCSTITSNDDVAKSGIVAWTAHMSNEADYGYTGAGEYVSIDAHLYQLIPTTDFRRNSFVNWDEDIVDSDYEWSEDWPDYASTKFRPGLGDKYNYLVGNAVSQPLMRVEEMMLIEAEAAGRQSLANGVEKLNDFVQTYRNPDYLYEATDLDDFIEAVWIQRRIEFWGEGIAPFDLKRLDKPVIRSYAGTNHAVGERINTTGYPTWLDFVIPRNEITSNNGIPIDANNPAPSNPGDSPEHVW